MLWAVRDGADLHSPNLPHCPTNTHTHPTYIHAQNKSTGFQLLLCNYREKRTVKSAILYYFTTRLLCVYPLYYYVCILYTTRCAPIDMCTLCPLQYHSVCILCTTMCACFVLLCVYPFYYYGHVHAVPAAVPCQLPASTKKTVLKKTNPKTHNLNPKTHNKTLKHTTNGRRHPAIAGLATPPPHLQHLLFLRGGGGGGMGGGNGGWGGARGADGSACSSLASASVVASSLRPVVAGVCGAMKGGLQGPGGVVACSSYAPLSAPAFRAPPVLGCCVERATSCVDTLV